MAIYKGKDCKISVSGVVLTLADSGEITPSYNTTMEPSIGTDIATHCDGVRSCGFTVTRKYSGDSLFEDLFEDRSTTFEIEMYVDSVGKKLIASQCKVTEYTANITGANDVRTETITGQARTWKFETQ